MTLPSVVRRARGLVAIGLLVGCSSSSPFDVPPDLADSSLVPARPGDAALATSVRSPGAGGGTDGDAPMLTDDSEPEDYVRVALHRNPRVEAAYQRWRAAAERLPQVGALPDPRVTFGVFVNEVETRVGPQQARIGVEQSFPWPGTRWARTDAAAGGARGAWRDLERVRLEVTEQVLADLHEVAYLDASIAITRENLDLLRSLESIVRTRYRVGTGSHPRLVQVQVELGLLEDRLERLRTARPARVAALNATLHRSASAPVPRLGRLPERIVAAEGAAELVEAADRHNPVLLALEERVEQGRQRVEAARKAGLPAFTVGADYLVTGDALDPSIVESGDDPLLLRLGVTVPIDRTKHDAAVREEKAARLALVADRAAAFDRIAADIERAWFEHVDADRRVRLYEGSLIPKARESLRASLAGFRAGETDFLDVLDTERTLLEFADTVARARADRGRSLATLHRLVGRPLPVTSADARPTTDTDTDPEVTR